MNALPAPMGKAPPAPSGGLVPRQIQTVYLTDKAKLAEAHWQALLRAPGLEFLCPCGLPVTPYFEPRHKGHNVRARPGEADLHARPDWQSQGCPVVHGEFALEAIKNGTLLYTDSIFLAPNAPRSTPTLRRNEATMGEFWYADFGHLMNQAFAHASLCALAKANRHYLERQQAIRNPTAKEIAEGIATFLGTSQMHDGTSPVDAARRVGATIVWGLCHRLLVERLHAMRYNPRDEILLLHEAWNVEGRLRVVPPVRIGYDVAVRLRGKVWEHNRLICPPYFVFASVDAAGRALQLLIIPICQLRDDQGLFSKESAAEDEFLFPIRQHAPSVGLVKLGVQADLHLLGNLWPHRLTAIGHLPCRPDAVVLGRRGTAIYQLAGSEDPFYRARVHRSLVALQDFLRNPNILVRAVTLAELRSGNPKFMHEIAAIS